MAGTTQRVTQSTQGKTQSTVADYIRQLNAQAAKFRGEKAAEANVDRIKRAIQNLCESGFVRLSKITSHLISECDKDGSKHLAEFSENFFVLVDNCDPNNNEARVHYLSVLLDHLCSHSVSLPSFVAIYNIFLAQSEKVSARNVMTLCENVTKRVEDPTATVSTRWRDCVVVLVRRLLETASDDVDQKPMTSPAMANAMMSDWLRRCASPSLFPFIVALINESGSVHVVRSFVRDDLQKALDRFDDLPDDEKRLWSLRAIELMEKSEEEAKEHKGDRMRLMKALVTIWSIPDDTTEPSIKPCPALSDSITLFTSLCSQHAVLGKQIIALFKSDRSRFFSSEFGFASIVSLLGGDRHKDTAALELKRTVVKLFRMEEEATSHGLLSDAFPRLTQPLQTQTKLLISRMEEGAVWEKMAAPLMDFAYSLIDNNQGPVPLSMAEGRVSDGPPCWMYASRTIRAVIAARPSGKSVSVCLSQLIECISAATNSNAALVLIDILVEVVRDNAADVLNNSRALESIPEYACRMRRDVSVCLIRALLPVFHQRVHIREALVTVLKKDMLNDKTAESAIPLLLLLFHSLSPSSASSSQHRFSQSFATFSSQSLASMGCARPRDEDLRLQIIGCVRRCLSQPAPLQAALYNGLADALSRDHAISEHCLDLLVGHSYSIPEWNAQSMVISTDSLTQLKEAFPHFVHAVSSVSRHVIAAGAQSNASTADSLIEKSNELLRQWALKAAKLEMEDLALDKLSDWSRGTREGRATLVFGHMMEGLYDALIDHLWMRVTVYDEAEDKECLNTILHHRKELVDLLKDRMVKRKGATKGGGEGPVMDLTHGQVSTSLGTLWDAVDALIGKDPPNGLDALPMLEWTIGKILMVSTELAKPSHSLMNERTPTAAIVAAASHLLSLYMGVECAQWVQCLESSHHLKTSSITAYSRLLQWLLSRHSNSVDRISTIWLSEEERAKCNHNTALMKHVHIVVTKLMPKLLTLEKDVTDKEGRKEEKAEKEQQAIALSKAVECLLQQTTSKKAAPSTFHLIVSRVLNANAPDNVVVLREVLRLLRVVGQRIAIDDDSFNKFTASLADQLMGVLSEELLEDTAVFVSPLTANVIADFLFDHTEANLEAMKSGIAFLSHFAADESKLCSSLTCISSLGLSQTRLLSHILPLHTRFSLHKDKMVALLTSHFTTLDSLFKTVQSTSKTFSVGSWECLDRLAATVTTLGTILAEVDEHVGTLNPEEDERARRGKRKQEKTKKDESVFVKYVKAREGVQSTILILSKTLKDQRFNLQVKNNSIGLRDFRIDLKVLTENVKRANEMDETASPQSKRRRKGDENDDPPSPIV